MYLPKGGRIAAPVCALARNDGDKISHQFENWFEMTGEDRVFVIPNPVRRLVRDLGYIDFSPV